MREREKGRERGGGGERGERERERERDLVIIMDHLVVNHWNRKGLSQGFQNKATLGKGKRRWCKQPWLASPWAAEISKNKLLPKILKGSSNFVLDPLEIILDLAHAAMIIINL